MDAEALRLVLYPDPILRQKAAAVEGVDDRVRDLVEAMFELMYEHRGVGLAAPQVGWSARVFVVNAENDQGPEGEKVYINPRVVEAGEATSTDEEGCLSIPDVRGKVTRPVRVLIEALDLDGKTFREDLSGLSARVFQHELDHLEGVLFISRIGASERLFARKTLRRLEKEYRGRKKQGSV